MMKRIESIDKARGLVMVIMTLDHVREFLHISSASANPLDLQTTTGLLFLTRWVTHLCAPAFVLISGIAAYQYMYRSGSLKAARVFFLTRGIWLVVLEGTLVNFALWFDIHFRLIILEVIGAIGLGFIVLSLLAGFSASTVGIAGLVLILTHGPLQFIPAPENPLLNLLTLLLFRPGMIQVGAGTTFLSSYPMLPWLGIMLTGFGMGAWFLHPPAKRQKMLIQTGGLFLLLFLVLRFVNHYGDPVAWSVQKNGWFTMLSFVNVGKYPPSLLFSLLFTGLTLWILAAAETVKLRHTSFLSVYGRVPLFYFILHLYTIHILMFAMLMFQGFTWKALVFGSFQNGRPAAGGGVELWMLYLIWLAVLLVLYPVCKAYGHLKSLKPGNPLLRYL